MVQDQEKLMSNWPWFYQEPDTDKVYLYAKDPFESNYQLLINGIVKIGIRNLENPKALIDCSQMIDDV